MSRVVVVWGDEITGGGLRSLLPATEIVDCLVPRRANSAKSTEKPLRAALLAEPFPGAMAQGGSLPKVREMNALSFGQNQRAAQISGLRMRGRSERVASIFAAVGKASETDASPTNLAMVVLA